MRYEKLARLAGGVAAVVLLAACTSGADNPTGTPTEVPAAATTTPTTEPAVAVAPGMFTGYVHCRLIAMPSGGLPDAIYQSCNQVATDPRMAGTVDLGPISVSDDSELLPASFTASGPSVITNDQGSWVCKEAGMGVYANNVYMRDLACVGKGENIGLSAWLHAVTSDGAMNWSFLGWIAKT